MRMFSLSLKYKVMVLLTVVPLLLLASYLILVIKVFETDKIAYIYDTNSSVNRSVASQARGVFLSILTSIRPILQEYFSYGEFGILSKEVLRGDSNLLFIGIIKSENGMATVHNHIEKEQDYYTDLIKNLNNLSVVLNTQKGDGHLVKTPFDNDNILLLESVENPSDRSLTHFAIIFKNQELSDLFSTSSRQRFFLTTENGEILFHYKEKKPQNISSDLLDSAFFKKVRDKKATEGTELLNQKKDTFLVSYNRIGFSNLLVTSMIDQKRALSAIQVLVTKSLLFAGLLLCITLIVSIVGSRTLTQTLRDLLKATQRIAQGDFTSRVSVKSHDEIGSLAKSFNLMSQEVARLLNETEEKVRMQGELQTARTVQETLFPQNVQVFDNLYIAGHYEPASECGGDWWYYSKVSNKIIFCIGDATGHGAPAALITSATRSAVSILENFILDAHQMMRLLNKSIYDVSKGQLMMTFFLGILDLETRLFTYCNASHEPPFLLKGNIGSPRKRDLIPLMEVNSARLGQDPYTHFDQAQFVIEPDDFVLFYTDGIAEIRNPEGIPLGEREFIKVLLQSLSLRSRPEQFVNHLNRNLHEFRADSGLIDDVTFFCVRYGGAA